MDQEADSALTLKPNEVQDLANIDRYWMWTVGDAGNGLRMSFVPAFASTALMESVSPSS